MSQTKSSCLGEKRFAVRTLGCKVNQYETEAIEELFLKNGYVRALPEEPCDIYVINTCTVTRLSDAKCRQQIRRVRRKNPAAIIAVIGCYAQVAPEEIAAIEGVDIILGTKGRASLVARVEQFARDGQRINAVTDLEEDRCYDEITISTELSLTRAHVKIQEGCDMFCSYCIIPYARGHIASRPLPSIRSELDRLADQGFHEVIFTGIHIASYGKENHSGIGLIDVLEEAASVPEIQRIRLSSIEPRWVDEDKLQRMVQTQKICDHFHLSLQSGSDRILRAMNRHYTTAQYRERVALIREFYPDAGMTTDVIVGFPGETEADFAETMAFCQEMGFSKIHIFPYSSRPGTRAAEWRDSVSPQEKTERAARLAAVEADLRHAFADRHIGKTVRVLFEEFSGDGTSMEGYSTNYLRVHCPRNPELINHICDVRVTGRSGDILIGEVSPS